METEQTKSESIVNDLPFSKTLATNLDDLDNRVFVERKASLIIIDGGLGEGKTTLAVHCVDYINKKHGLPEMDIEKGTQLALGGEQFIDKIDICYKEKLPIIIYDEAGDFGKRGALTRFNAMINRMFEMFRAYQIIVILCLPTFDVLDSSLIDKKIPRLLLNLHNRSLNQGNIRGFSYDRMGWLKVRMKKLVLKSYAYAYVDPNFYAHFKDLSPKRSASLDKISTANKRATNMKERIKYEGLLGYQEMANRVDKSVSYVKATIYKLGIKPARKVGNKSYYTEDDLDKVTEYWEGD